MSPSGKRATFTVWASSSHRSLVVRNRRATPSATSTPTTASSHPVNPVDEGAGPSGRVSSGAASWSPACVAAAEARVAGLRVKDTRPTLGRGGRATTLPGVEFPARWTVLPGLQTWSLGGSDPQGSGTPRSDLPMPPASGPDATRDAFGDVP